MKTQLLLILATGFLMTSCIEKPVHLSQSSSAPLALTGTWQLLSASTTEKGKTTLTNYTSDQQMIKIINDTHFAFLRHGSQEDAQQKYNFLAGGGRYELNDDNYTEYLDYFNDKLWEGKKFDFKISIRNDTLIQTGIEKVEGAGVDRTIIETYVRIKPVK